MMSDKFMNRAVEISVGSLSPTINWTTLKLQEFDLPPLDQQRRIAEVLLALDDVRQSRLAAHNSLGRLLESTARHLFSQLAPQNTPLGALIRDGDVELQTGPFGTVLAASCYTTVGVPVVNPVNMDGDSFDTGKGPFISPSEADRLSRYQMHPGDIVMCRKRHVGRMVEVRDEYDGFIVGSDCIRIRPNPSRLLSRFLLLYLRSGEVQRWLVRATIGSVMPGMNESILRKLEVPVPERDVQERVVASLGQILATGLAAKSELDELGQVARSLQNYIFADSIHR
jgi:restriction endonuclease S subunit